MIGTEPGREAVKKYMKENHITYRMAGVLFGSSASWIQQVLNGKAKGPEATKLIISMINEFGI
ncbi:hypothetical protein GBP13_00565 [Pediococcus acidilactici]|uniref:hypothetical protein n=2 Tax=Lactobacillaceae TaxID=33958 RepID=UPI000E5D34D0|nr:hypothetical protein [Pediococcus acidilactici]KAF0365190.1 hypothetical protein GBO50_00565 [Pediococcus acidilactici]KAF0369268.1 hypothetical protein GBO55_00565 [Pediococcus acidilactici]KAF0417761.1 hypothetical protein GBO80_07565 [Pediococcus acidilactici]KAF0420985.1 hypothetical protein GBO82_07220 [Pediococcus acidilactici]KAF0474930.1 hypothetical protein GBP08_00565 [Pediococcus acidilactici]